MSDNMKLSAVLYVYSKGSMDTDKLIEASVIRFCKDESGRSISVPIEIERQHKGKPFLPKIEDVHVSVTHSGEFCIVAVSDCGIGVDLQAHDRLKNETEDEAYKRYSKLSKRFFHPKENSYVEKDPLNRFFEVWCAKESYVKYTGEGIDDNFWTYSVIPDDFNENIFSWEKHNVHFVKTFFRKGYSLCVCLEVPKTVKTLFCEI